jgi:ribonuclease E
VLRALDDAAARQRAHIIEVRAATDVALYLLNEKRAAIAALEASRGVRVRILAGAGLTPPEFEFNVSPDTFTDDAPEAEARAPQRRDAAVVEEEEESDVAEDIEDEEEIEEQDRAPVAESDAEDSESRRRRRRGRRGGRKRREDGEAEPAAAAPREPRPEAAPATQREDRNGKRRRRRGRGRGGRRTYEVDGGEWLDFVGGDLKHLSPRPERRPPPQPRAEAPSPERGPVEVKVASRPAPEIVEDRREPISVSISEPTPEPVLAMAEAATTIDPGPDYEPDQERRDKFFSRLSRWAKK